MRKPDNLVALHRQETGSYVVEAGPTDTKPLDKWATNKILEARKIIAGLLEYAECNDPGCPHIGAAKGFLGRSES